MRVVSLACSNTEIVAALGCSELLVGVDDHSDYPPQVVGRLPRVGPDLHIDVERVAALKPDLVLASLTVPGHERVVDDVCRAGLSFVAPEPTSVADVYADVRMIAERLGVRDRGARLVERMQAELERPPPRRAHRPKILVEWWPKPVIVPGRSSWVHELIERAGAVNPFDEEVKSAPIDDERAVVLDPDAVVISWCGVPFDKYRTDIVYRRPAWRVLGALAKRRVYRVPEAYLGRPGPRLVDGLRELRRIADECADG